MKALISFSLVLVLVALGACEKPEEKMAGSENGTVEKTETSAGVPVKVMKLEPKDYREYGEYVGRIEAIREAKLTAYAGGRVDRIYKERGDRVKKGDKLCSIEGERFNTLYESALLSEKLAEEKLERNKVHLQKGTVSRTQLDRSRMEFLESKRLRLEAEKSRNGALCISPLSGIVVDRKIDAFDETNPGQVTFYVADTSKFKVTVGIPESEMDGYQVGNEAFLTIKSQGGLTVKGRVISLSQKVDPTQRTFLMDLEFDNTNESIKPGMTGRIKVLRYDLKDKLVIPSDAILVLTNDKAVIVVEDGKAVKKFIEISSNNDSETLISKGITFGDQLVIQGQMQAVDGSSVNIIQ